MTFSERFQQMLDLCKLSLLSMNMNKFKRFKAERATATPGTRDCINVTYRHVIVERDLFTFRFS
jgi:hypothetical protein